jgi:hypothetical protein
VLQLWRQLLALPHLLQRDSAAENITTLLRCFNSICSAALPHLQTGACCCLMLTHRSRLTAGWDQQGPTGVACAP